MGTLGVFAQSSITDWVSIQRVGQLKQNNKYTFRINYSMSRARDIVVAVRSPSNVFLGSKKVRITPPDGGGSTLVNVTVNLNRRTTIANNYRVKATIRPTGRTTNLKSETQRFNVVRNGKPAPDGQPLFNEVHAEVKDAIDKGIAIPKFMPQPGWKDSYEANGLCWCSSGFDHDLGNKSIVFYRVNGIKRNIKDVCDELKKHPQYATFRGSRDTPYNDIQCGNGPYNTAKDEGACPGRTDISSSGCAQKGPKWDLNWLQGRSRFRVRSSKALTSKELSTYNEEIHVSINRNPIKLGENSFLNITSPFTQDGTISLYDLSGKLLASIKNKDYSEVTSSVNLSPLFKSIKSAGSYILLYESPNMTKSINVLLVD